MGFYKAIITESRVLKTFAKEGPLGVIDIFKKPDAYIVWDDDQGFISGLEELVVHRDCNENIISDYIHGYIAG
tara:strand:- start:7961 stop:8179 length:219 start_codon:yes stop_codon:yes gene_type:complete